MSDATAAVTSTEPHDGSLARRLNWLRAGVLGANDGIVSTAGVVVGVAGATSDHGAILVAGVAALAAGAMSMAAGEYVSVSTQRDSEKALIALERRELAEDPEGELAELVELYEAKGLTPETARRVAEELTAVDPLAAHLDAELGLDEDALTSPWQAAGASMLAFTVGALLPLLTIGLAPESVRTVVTVVAVTIALALTGWVSARLGRSPVVPAAVRNVAGGLLAMGVTYAVGALVGTSIGG
ncbi:VIT1/CCC1 transporter family protein [Terracoccus luteus]|uniref:VIT1/CCC1 family predicted Fe2+/Mn2+ transporter n=1 Tax=Terracoccus luteus TaxID=53356 RepID=A0A839PW84_9MICO|nr:VIT family protein [Terracoccus luteus]MBB2987569.1 VIT1/CCC1 family predicted Fe2+/Mn2+ transporter [Terracoccus luteus]MCP2173220.1 VIT1/CCC1 family predicted Fe2+/Mn2+ transporter [Terracoccus luteus]